MSQALIVVNRS